ncbi:hypothetical protein scyTo_0005900, partial [Scyliorhinus torazame]|nr:hypothetical protein [Scyliorhinus torazame]
WRAIPSRRVTVSDLAQLPQDYSSTPGDTLFSTPPGGTRIIYDRKFLMDCRNSSVARTPPRDLPNIPGVTSLNTAEKVKPATNNISHEGKAAGGDDAQFEMDI